MGIDVYIALAFEAFFITMLGGYMLYFFGSTIFAYIRQRYNYRKYNSRNRLSRRDLYFQQQEEMKKTISEKIKDGQKVIVS